jgi:hypothetical protein
MAIKAGVGMSCHHDPNVAGREAAEQALQKTVNPPWKCSRSTYQRVP